MKNKLKLWFLNLFIFATQCHKPLIFKAMNAVRSNNLNFKGFHWKLLNLFLEGIVPTFVFTNCFCKWEKLIRSTKTSTLSKCLKINNQNLKKKFGAHLL